MKCQSKFMENNKALTFINTFMSLIDTVKHRLVTYLDYKGVSKSEFGRTIGVSSAYVTSMRKSIQPDKLKAISESYPDLNTNWLLTGEGEMLISDSMEHEIVEAQSRDGLIPFYEAETTGGFQGLVSSSDTGSELVGYIQSGGWFAGRDTAAIRHVGDSMIEYPNGCILAVREVLDRHLLVPGKNYVIETSEYRVTKRVQRGSTSNTISLYSSNQEKYDDGRLIYEPFEVDMSDIRRIFSILGYIVNQSGEYKLIKI